MYIYSTDISSSITFAIYNCYNINLVAQIILQDMYLKLIIPFFCFTDSYAPVLKFEYKSDICFSMTLLCKSYNSSLENLLNTENT